MDAAYFDRITNDQNAVLLIESSQQNFVVPIDKLPIGSQPGHWFLVTIENNNLTTIQFDEKKTEEMTQTIQNQLARLQKNKKSRFKRNN